MEGYPSAQQGSSASITPSGALEPLLVTLLQDSGVHSRKVSGGAPQSAREAAAAKGGLDGSGASRREVGEPAPDSRVDAGGQDPLCDLSGHRAAGLGEVDIQHGTGRAASSVPSEGKKLLRIKTFSTGDHKLCGGVEEPLSPVLGRVRIPREACPHASTGTSLLYGV